MHKISIARNLAWIAFIAGVVSASAQDFSVLVNFDRFNGANPAWVTLAQGTDGNLYGTTKFGGRNNGGTLFRLTPDGDLKTLYSFCAESDCPNGEQPVSGMILASDGNFYGTTATTVFRASLRDGITTLYRFCTQECPNGNIPNALIQGADGMLYGTTNQGGKGNCPNGCGTVFRMNLQGDFTTTYMFADKDGGKPQGPLVEGPDGNLYGTTQVGGDQTFCPAYGCGTIFRITPEGKLTTLHQFDKTQGYLPISGLTLGRDGAYYGVTLSGGNNASGIVFKTTSEGDFTPIYYFGGGPDGGAPETGLGFGRDGKFYGTTTVGGDMSCAPQGCGTIFVVTSEGQLTTLHDVEPEDGTVPEGVLVQHTNGKFYATTLHDGLLKCQFGCGTAYSLNVGLVPFVSLMRATAKAGFREGILGQGFTGATNVFFNGTSAEFSVRSDTFIEATVPVGVTNGFVTVVTPKGKLQSNRKFKVWH